ncbi:MAG: carbohydrate kinase [Ferruginibacter sp.]|uniref:gluconokinase n=1 Tax=Ferruginibacter sp. TaxID=1940288 RepID=UPI002657CA9C|nr:gluconokinase [Ferruginibacter sp.]MDB5275817.1 carbohydrate kinase [Ferruginibacter sp.]
MDYFIGIDIGTTSTKAVAFSSTGVVLAKQSSGYPILHPQENQSEQNPQEILKAVIQCLTGIAKQLPHDVAVLISFSAAMHSLILMDVNDQPLTNCIIWADNRAGELAVALKQTPQGEKYYHSTGVPIHAMSPLCKMFWFKKNEPLFFSKCSKFIGIKEFVFHRLFGKYIVDTAIASATGLLNSTELQWEADILADLGIEKNHLSTIVPCPHIEYLRTEIQSNTAEQLKAFKETAFVVGSSDGALANLGSGATAAGSMAVTIGTSSAARVVTSQPITDKSMRTFCYHLNGEQYILGGASSNGAIVIQWLKEQLLKDKTAYDEFINLATNVAAGSDKLLLLPYILGERAPLWNPDARGVYFSLDIKHTTAHLVRAAMESVVYNVYSIGKILMEKSPVTTIYANGGFTESPLWVQMLADTFNLPVNVIAVEECSALGAVMVGMQALALPYTMEIAVGKTYLPDQSNHQIYQRQCAKMERLYELVKAEF